MNELLNYEFCGSDREAIHYTELGLGSGRVLRRRLGMGLWGLGGYETGTEPAGAERGAKSRRQGYLI